MRCQSLPLLVVLAALVAPCARDGASAQEPAKIDFARDVQPLFKAHCIGCHGPKKQNNGFRLDRRRDALRGGSLNMIGPGNAVASRLYLRLIGDSVGLQMPPDGPLSPEQVKVIKAWIDQGAVWPDAASGETPAPPPDPDATRLMDVLRGGDRAAVRKLLREQPRAATRKGPGGATPLMYAALYGEAEEVRLLLAAGADANARNEAGATALMWAVDDLDKTRLLLRHGADPNACSDDGRTPILVATAWARSYEIVKLLLDRGANPSQVVNTYRGPVNPLRQAAEKGDEGVLRLLLDRGADAKAQGGVLPLVAATGAQDNHCMDLLLRSADRSALKAVATLIGPPFTPSQGLRGPRSVKNLVDHGADLAARDDAGRTALMLAVSSDDVSVETVETMIQLGADVNASTPGGRTALDFARQHGTTPVVDLLVKAGAKAGRGSGPPEVKPKPAASPRAAVERALPLLQRADVTFFRKAGCVSCHHNALTAMTVSAARKAGIPVDERAARNQRRDIGAYAEVWRERALQGSGIPGDSDTVGYILAGLAAEEYPPDPATDALARYLKNDQLPDGRSRINANRPPLESSEIELTALAVRALRSYAPQAQRHEYEKAVWRAADWLRTARPRTTTDRAFQLLGLIWAGDDKDALQKAARELLAEQRDNGGWGQLSSLTSDAYATGQALVALRESGAIAVTDPAYKRGVEYLLSTQLEDGSWYVRSRAIPFQPYFESGFPHGQDQWISVAATNWATTALLPAAR
ncbi:MAG: ankyrin repeat domain-containing protein [Gemmataceae bacterium]